MPIPFDHWKQHPPPELGTVVVAAPQHGPLQIAELVEQKQRLVTETCKVAVVGRAPLSPKGLTDGTVTIKDEFFQRSSPMHLVDPLTEEIH